jgi:thioredoxin-like negative regulator of GroEL
LQNDFQQRRSAFEELAQALQSGNLAQAQQAFSVLTQNAPNSGQAKSGSLKDDFSALAQALQSGDLDGARTAFATIQQDLQKARQAHHHHHHHHTQQESSGSNSSSDPSSGSGAQPADTNLSIIA